MLPFPIGPIADYPAIWDVGAEEFRRCDPRGCRSVPPVVNSRRGWGYGLLSGVRTLLGRARPVWTGAVAVGRVLPRVSRRLTLVAAWLVVAVAAAPVALSVVSAQLVAETVEIRGGTVPSSTTWLVLGIALLLMVQEVSRQSLNCVARALGRRVD